MYSSKHTNGNSTRINGTAENQTKSNMDNEMMGTSDTELQTSTS